MNRGWMEDKGKPGRREIKTASYFEEGFVEEQR